MFTGELRPYQEPAVARMVDRGLFLLSAGVGTGKTPMTIAAVEALRDEFGDGFCGVWVTAGGLKKQTAEAIAQFTDGATVLVIDGPPAKREQLYAQALAEKPQYVILGYDQVVDDYSLVEALEQQFVVVDEVTAIKNPSAAITQAVRACFGEAPFRYGLTGTPSENGRCDEVFQIAVWIDDTVFGRADLFDKTFVKRDRYGRVKEYRNLELFNELLAEFSVTIDADDPGVREYMPEMTRPKRVLVEMDEEGARVYEHIARELEVDLAELARKKRGKFDLAAFYSGQGGDDKEAAGRVMSKIGAMRMLCAHPDVLVESALQYLEGRERMEAEPDGWPLITKKDRRGRPYKVPKPVPGSAYAAALYEQGLLGGLDESPKLDEVCLDIDHLLTDPVNKVVVFAYHKMVLRVLERRYAGKAVRYDGDLSLKRRDANKAQFKADPATRLFLSSDAGGYGVDLPEANWLLELDIPFTAGRVTQRHARIRRASTEFHDTVHVRSYLIDNSVEVYYADLTEGKQKAVTAMRTGKGAVKGRLVMSPATLGAYLSTHRV